MRVVTIIYLLSYRFIEFRAKMLTKFLKRNIERKLHSLVNGFKEKRKKKK